MNKLRLFGAVCATLLTCFTLPANAALTYVDGAGNAVSAPAVIDEFNEAIYFTETSDGSGNGQYTVTNNTVDYGLLAFGISNEDTFAWIDSIGDDFGCQSSWCYGSSNLDAENWGLTPINPFSGETGQDIFGDISNVLDPGDNTLNFYTAEDGDLQSGDSWDQFLFSSGIPSSQLFVVLDSPSGAIYGSGGQPVNAIPIPAAVWLFGSGLLGLVGMARRKKTA